jgi:hypothetical protein
MYIRLTCLCYPINVNKYSGQARIAISRKSIAGSSPSEVHPSTRSPEHCTRRQYKSTALKQSESELPRAVRAEKRPKSEKNRRSRERCDEATHRQISLAAEG